MISLSALAQNNWKTGYYLTLGGIRNNGLIFDKGWNNNPVNFKFKADENAAEIVYDANSVKEFGIVDEYKFERHEVNLERSSTRYNNLQKGKTPFFNKETLFLRTLVAGKYTLYVYNENGLEKFFYKVGDGNVLPLIQITYLDNDGIKVRENNQYKNDLFKASDCAKMTVKDAENLKYTVASLADYFSNLNSCGDAKSVSFEQVKKKGSINLKVLGGVSPSKFKFDGNFRNYNFSISKVIPFYGVEVEYILPTNNSKWSVTFEMNYSTFSGDVETKSGRHVDVKYNLLQFPVGVRHYLFLNTESKLFFSGVIAPGFALGSSLIDYENSNDYVPEPNVLGIGLGIGYEYKNISAEIRPYTKLGLVRDIEGGFSKIAFTLKYKIL